MKQFKGTHEHWYVENLHEPKEGMYPAFEINISSESEKNICTVWYSDQFDETAKANALLMSKSLKLLHTLNEVNDYIKHLYGESSITKELDGIIIECTDIESKEQEDEQGQ